jgi:nitroreductase
MEADMAQDASKPAFKSRSAISVEDAIGQRSSVRAYAPGKLPWTSVKALLSAAVRAPTAMHQEPWAFAVVQDPALLKRISERARQLMADEPHPELLHRGGHVPDVFAEPGFDVFHGAGTLIVIGTQSDGRFAVADCWLAAENLMLRAFAMNLGACVIGSAIGALDLPEVKSEIGLPDDFRTIAPIVVGTPAMPVPPTPRREPRLLAWI